MAIPLQIGPEETLKLANLFAVTFLLASSRICNLTRDAACGIAFCRPPLPTSAEGVAPCSSIAKTRIGTPLSLASA